MPTIKEMLAQQDQVNFKIKRDKFQKAKEKLSVMNLDDIEKDIVFDPDIDAQILEDTKPKRGRPAKK